MDPTLTDTESPPTATDGGEAPPAATARGRRRWPWITAAVVGGLLVVLYAAWAVDTWLVGPDVPRNVTLAGADVGGLDDGSLSGEVDEVATTLESTEITVETENGSVTLPAVDLGLSVDRDETRRLVKAAGGNEGFVLLRPFRWLGSLAGDEQAPVAFVLDRTALEAALADLVAANRVEPVEPVSELTPDGVTLVGGVVGSELDLGAVEEELVDAARTGDLATTIEAPTTSIPPQRADADVQAAIDEINRQTSAPLSLSAGGRTVEVSPETLRTWFVVTDADGSVSARLDDGAVGTFLGDEFADLRVDPVDAGFTLVAGAGVQITPDSAGQACCAPDSFDRIAAALDEGTGSVQLDLEILAPARDLARAQELGIVEPIAGFTTYHAAGQSRVTNIHRMADIVQGAVIEPGGTFSLNDYVGPRTRDKGFVEAGVIYRGEYEEDVGGGVSQFTTTLFNAAFFAGLEFEEYQSHSIYISRYPYGREATLSFPHPDLRFTNNTPYGIMIWPTYTAGAITVTLWSTPYIQAADTGQSERPDGNCTRVTTERTRTWPDGRTEVDSVFARYRPGEGVDC